MLDRQQLVNVVASGIDDHDQRIVLLPNGDFKLVPFHTPQDSDAFHNLDYVTHFGTLDAGNDYVGLNAAKDDKWIDQVFNNAVEIWDEYQKNGKRPIVNMTL